MSRHVNDDHDDADDVLPQKSPKRANRAAFVIALVIGVAAVLVGVFVVRMLLQSAGSVTTERAEQQIAIAHGPAGTRKYTRDEFGHLAMGKTETELLERFGRPDSVNDSGPQLVWTYRRRTVDASTGRTDEFVNLYFEQGKVSDLDY